MSSYFVTLDYSRIIQFLLIGLSQSLVCFGAWLALSLYLVLVVGHIHCKDCISKVVTLRNEDLGILGIDFSLCLCALSIGHVGNVRQTAAISIHLLYLQRGIGT